MEDSTDLKTFYTIREAASILEENESTLRYWEGEFPDIITPRRNERGVRFYSEKDIDNVRLIKHLVRDCRLTFEGVRKRLKDNKESAVRQARVTQHLKQIRAELKALEKTFDEVGKTMSKHK
jgi:DNA-binding transcriptional MerR regulator